MTGDEWFEIRARAFFLMRGMTVPTEETIDLPGYPIRSTRTAAWVAWNADHAQVLNALRAALEEQNRSPFAS
jgi:hypothetical protein